MLAHAVVYAAVNGVLVAVWVLTAGSTDELQAVAERPSESVSLGFWPVWPILLWGAVLAMHAGVALVLAPRRLRRRLRGARPVPPSPPPVPTATLGPRAGTGRDAPPRRRWVVVMFTDLCDSTSENERLGDEVWHELLGRYRDIVRTAVGARDGTEIATTGDGFLLCFDSPSEAVLAGVDVQRALARGREVDPRTPHTRIGVHAGEVVDDGSDVLGHVVNLASRVSAVAERDEILVTEPVSDLLVGTLRIEDRGLKQLRGVSHPRHLLAVRWEE